MVPSAAYRRIVRLLEEGPDTVSNIALELELPKNLVRARLSELRRLEVVRVRNTGYPKLWELK